MGEEGAERPCRRWAPAVPLRDVVAGRVLVALPMGFLLAPLTALVGGLTGLRMTAVSVLGFSLLAVTARETLDVACMRITMRIRRSNTYRGRAATALTLLCPLIAGLAASSTIFRPGRGGAIALALLVMLAYLLMTLLVRPWGRRLRHEELERRRRSSGVSQQDLFRTGVENGIFAPVDLPDDAR